MEEREKFISLISAAAAEAPFHAVIDFTGFHCDYVRDTIKALHTVSEAEVRKRCPCLYIVLRHIICQDRLGTNIQKNREQRQRVTETVFVLAGHPERRPLYLYIHRLCVHGRTAALPLPYRRLGANKTSQRKYLLRKFAQTD